MPPPPLDEHLRLQQRVELLAGQELIEEMIWGKATYLEENTFSTGHQMVNVYRRPERYYEVRSDDSAIYVQIHENQQDGPD